MTPSFQEDHISQIPAIQFLCNLGYEYLTPQQALELRGGKTTRILLEEVVKKKLKEINSISYKGKNHSFTDSNIINGIHPYRFNSGF